MCMKDVYLMHYVKKNKTKKTNHVFSLSDNVQSCCALHLCRDEGNMKTEQIVFYSLELTVFNYF